MAKELYKNRRLKKYFEDYVRELYIEKKYRPIVVDILMRRADYFELSPEDIRQDVESLLDNLDKISIQKMPKGEENTYGIYYPDEREILISKKLLKGHDDELYQTITHEVYHALSMDENGEDRLGGYNTITGEYNSSLLEAIIEKASYRAVFGNDKQENIYYNNSARGYADITFIIDALEATYGVSEKEFLKNAILGRKRLAKFLSTRSGETPQSAYTFLDAIESNYALLHRSLYPMPEEKISAYQKESNIESALTGIYNLCEGKIAERIERFQAESYEDVVNLNDELKYDHNKLSVIMRDKIQFFSNRYNGLNNKVYFGANESRLNTLKRINDIDSLVEATPRYRSETDFLNTYTWAAYGKLDELPQRVKSFYGLRTKSEYLFTITQDVVDRAFYDEDFGTIYDNTKIPMLFKKIKKKNIFKTGIEKVKNLFLRKDQKLITSGALPQSASILKEEKSSTIFQQLTPNQLEQYNNQVRQAVENINRNGIEEKNDKNEER